MKRKDKRKIKKLLIDAMAFLEVDAYTGVYDACDQVRDIIDGFDYNKVSENEIDYGDPDYEDNDSSF